jgi:hypothetical protein
MIRLGTSGWELYPGPKCVDCHPYPGLRDRFWARIFLHKLTKEALASAAIRHLLSREVHSWPHTRITADDASDHMAVLLSRGTWHVHASARPKAGAESNYEPEQEGEDEFTKVAPASREPVGRPQPAEEEGSLPRSADEAAIAAVLKMASKLGILFCEECTKADLKKPREAAYA